jgi:hypothetical protein
MDKALRTIRERSDSLVRPGVEAVKNLPKEIRKREYSFNESMLPEAVGDFLTPVLKAADTLDCTVDFIKSDPEHPKAAGGCDTVLRRITVHEHPSYFQAYILAHEVAHCTLKHGIDPFPEEEDNYTAFQTNVGICLGEIEAEAVAHIVCDHLGLDSQELCSRYITYYLFKLELMDYSHPVWTPERIERIESTARTILNSTDKTHA